MTSVLSLDFGSAYTKIAIRREPDRASELMEEPSLNLDELRICIPSVVAREQRGATPRWAFGIEAVNYKEGKDIRVFRNWKPHLFSLTEPPLAAGGPPTPVEFRQPGDVAGFLDALREAKEERQALYQQIAGQMGMMVEDVVAVAKRWPLGVEDLRHAVAELRPQERVPRREPPGRLHADNGEIRDVALQYFGWLREFAGGAFRGLGVSGIDRMPLRLCVPAFSPPGPSAPLTSSEEALLNILALAGWTVDEDCKKVDEPFANAVGALTGGINRTWVPPHGGGKRFANMGLMFAESGLIKALKESRADHVILVVDVGAYTSDFAVLKFDPTDVDSRPAIRTHSVPLGVGQLDREVQGLLPAPKAAQVEAMDFGRRESLKGHIYVEASPYMTEAGPVGGGEEGSRISRYVAEFGARVADQADHFVRGAGFERVDELVLTGGGNNIPGIRTTLRDRLQHKTTLKTHLPLRKGEPEGPRVHRLDQKLVRGASALGAVSVYFDRL